MAFGNGKRTERRADDEREALVAEALEARQAGRPLYFCSIPVSSSKGNLFGGASPVSPNVAVSEALALIEAQGWRLEHAGYVFIQQGAHHNPGVGGFGGTGVSGVVQGQFTFRPV